MIMDMCNTGLRVASVESTSAVAALGVFIEAGSRFENDKIQGTLVIDYQMNVKTAI
jgi:hypothetical protein